MKKPKVNKTIPTKETMVPVSKQLHATQKTLPLIVMRVCIEFFTIWVVSAELYDGFIRFICQRRTICFFETSDGTCYE